VVGGDQGWGSTQVLMIIGLVLLALLLGPGLVLRALDRRDR
jgi:hypothetical protein